MGLSFEEHYYALFGVAQVQRRCFDVMEADLRAQFRNLLQSVGVVNVGPRFLPQHRKTFEAFAVVFFDEVQQFFYAVYGFDCFCAAGDVNPKVFRRDLVRHYRHFFVVFLGLKESYGLIGAVQTR